MRLLLAAFVLGALFAPTVLASCPNECSGHGYCNQYNACNCFRNWMGADCSARQCAWGHSFIDIPQGDLNADGRVDVPEIYTVTLCGSHSFFDTDGNGSPTTTFVWPSSYADSQGKSGAGGTAGNNMGSHAWELNANDQETTTGTAASNIRILGASSGAWTTGIDIMEKVSYADEYNTGNDPHNVVKHCRERDADLVYAIVVHVRASYDPPPMCYPNQWSFGPQYAAGHATTGMTSSEWVENGRRCTDDFTEAAGTGWDTPSTPALLRSAVITLADDSITLENVCSGTVTGKTCDRLASTDGTAACPAGCTQRKLYVGSWNDQTYTSQQSNDLTWERYPDDHFHAGGQMKTYSDSVDTAVFMSKGKWDEAHFYAECSAKGLCDRATGLCQCFPGYTGDGCKRTACPDGCSGHGTCERLVDANVKYLGWDAYKTQHCVCDPGYEGANCALRMCPLGDDPIKKVATSNLQSYTVDGMLHSGHRNQRSEIQLIGVGEYGNLVSGKGSSSDKAAFFSLEATDIYGDKWATRTIDFRQEDCTATAGTNEVTQCLKTEDAIEDAIEALPNSVFANVEVNYFKPTPPTYSCGSATDNVAYECEVEEGKAGHGWPLSAGTSVAVTVIDPGTGPSTCATGGSAPATCTTATHATKPSTTKCTTCANDGDECCVKYTKSVVVAFADLTTETVSTNSNYLVGTSSSHVYQVVGLTNTLRAKMATATTIDGHTIDKVTSATCTSTDDTQGCKPDKAAPAAYTWEDVDMSLSDHDSATWSDESAKRRQGGWCPSPCVGAGVSSLNSITKSVADTYSAMCNREEAVFHRSAQTCQQVCAAHFSAGGCCVGARFRGTYDSIFAGATYSRPASLADGQWLQCDAENDEAKTPGAAPVLVKTLAACGTESLVGNTHDKATHDAAQTACLAIDETTTAKDSSGNAGTWTTGTAVCAWTSVVGTVSGSDWGGTCAHSGLTAFHSDDLAYSPATVSQDTTSTDARIECRCSEDGDGAGSRTCTGKTGGTMPGRLMTTADFMFSTNVKTSAIDDVFLCEPGVEALKVTDVMTTGNGATGGTGVPQPGATCSSLVCKGPRLFAITFAENAGNIPTLGARFKWFFDSNRIFKPASYTFGAAGAARNSGYQSTHETCDWEIITATNFDGNGVTHCLTSKSLSTGAFDHESAGSSFFVKTLFEGDKDLAVCSNRGLCDYSTGLCKCFAGFTKHDCSVQNSLATHGSGRASRAAAPAAASASA